MMKKIFFAIIVTASLSSCKTVTYSGNYGQVNQTQVVLNNANFKVLGSFTGVATEKILKLSIENQEGLVAKAKKDLLNNAKSEGITLTGSRTLINVTVDLIETRKRVTATVSAEIIEFTK